MYNLRNYLRSAIAMFVLITLQFVMIPPGSTYWRVYFVFGGTAPSGPATRFLHHIQRRTTVGRLLWKRDQLVAETST